MFNICFRLTFLATFAASFSTWTIVEPIDATHAPNNAIPVIENMHVNIFPPTVAGHISPYLKRRKERIKHMQRAKKQNHQILLTALLKVSAEQLFPTSMRLTRLLKNKHMYNIMHPQMSIFQILYDMRKHRQQNRLANQINLPLVRVKMPCLSQNLSSPCF